MEQIVSLQVLLLILLKKKKNKQIEPAVENIQDEVENLLMSSIEKMLQNILYIEIEERK